LQFGHLSMLPMLGVWREKRELHLSESYSAPDTNTNLQFLRQVEILWHRGHFGDSRRTGTGEMSQRLSKSDQTTPKKKAGKAGLFDKMKC